MPQHPQHRPLHLQITAAQGWLGWTHPSPASAAALRPDPAASLPGTPSPLLSCSSSCCYGAILPHSPQPAVSSCSREPGGCCGRGPCLRGTALAQCWLLPEVAQWVGAEEVVVANVLIARNVHHLDPGAESAWGDEQGAEPELPRTWGAPSGDCGRGRFPRGSMDWQLVERGAWAADSHSPWQHRAGRAQHQPSPLMRLQGRTWGVGIPQAPAGQCRARPGLHVPSGR